MQRQQVAPLLRRLDAHENITEDANSLNIARAVAALAKSLGMASTAEGSTKTTKAFVATWPSSTADRSTNGRPVIMSYLSCNSTVLNKRSCSSERKNCSMSALRRGSPVSANS